MNTVTNLTRRAFLRLAAGGSLAMAIGDLGQQFPRNWISEPLPPVGNIKPAELIRYATTCRECPAGCGMHIHHVNGRSIKAEGNPDHPVNRGGLCARGQSALQGLYDPDRLTRPRRRTAPGGDFPDTTTLTVGWQEALREIGGRLRRKKGRALVVSRLETGTLASVMRQFTERFDGELLLFEPFDYRAMREINAAAIGSPDIPWHALDRCETILSFGADFLESWVSNVQFTWMFTRMHDYNGETGDMGAFAYVGPRLSMTAANADDFLPVPPGAEYDVAMNLLKIMADRGWTKGGEFDYRELTRAFRPEDLPLADAAARLDRLAEKFTQGGPSVALGGPPLASGGQARRLAEAVFLLNRAAGNFGKTVDFAHVHALGTTAYREDLRRLAEGLGPDDILFLHETNPAYAMPGLAAALRQAGLVVVLGQMPDETSLLADWLLPLDNPLESWGDYSPWTGIRGLMQPTMQRIHDTRGAGDIFLSLADLGGRPLVRPGSEGADLDFASWLRADWQGLAPGAGEQDGAIAGLLRQGFHQDDTAARPMPQFRTMALSPPAPSRAPGQQAADVADLWLWPSIFHFDGRTANRTWLQENPQPDGYIAWGSWAEIHPKKAEALGLAEGDGVSLTSGLNQARLQVRITDQIAEHAVGLPLGLGHWALGETAAGLGASGFGLLSAGDDTTFGRVTLARAKGLGAPIFLTADRRQHEREILHWEKLAKIRSGNMAPSEITLPLPEGYARKYDIYPGHKHARHRWAMVIDLHRCIGCGACAVACYAENNLPTKGPERVREGREMAWLKVIPYEHPDKAGRIGYLPLPCQHCDQAPCEPVCPVFAAVNNEEGLNSQIYNRCIGTRYCSQNCPYKVRRFNWLDNHWRPPLQWQLNPEVTVRSRGVMEKCTFCVQRIRQAEYRAKREHRAIRDGEITPACVQSCPARVFTFGDLLDTTSAVHRLFRGEPRSYQVLHELNTKPAVLYLKKIEHT